MIDTIDTAAGVSVRGMAGYRLRVEGRLDELAFDYVDDLMLALTLTPGERTVTTLTCGPIDQSSLVGLINVLHDFGLPLMLVERLD
jgi:hypothetical protein